MTRTKICGLTRTEDVRLAVELGADAVGFVLVPTSKRKVPAHWLGELAAAAGPLVTRVAVIADLAPAEAAEIAAHVDALQLHGHEDRAYVEGLRKRLPAGYPLYKALRVQSPEDLQAIAPLEDLVQAIVLDSGGGTGVPFDWAIADHLRTRLPVILAGGLDARNVSEAIRRLAPYAVDVASGVEAAPGVKDPARMRAFIEAVRRS